MCVYDKQSDKLNLVPYLFQESAGDEALTKALWYQYNLLALVIY